MASFLFKSSPKISIKKYQKKESNKIEIIKAFTKMYITPSNFMVHPFLGLCREELEFKPDPTEVSAIIELLRDWI